MCMFRTHARAQTRAHTLACISDGGIHPGQLPAQLVIFLLQSLVYGLQGCKFPLILLEPAGIRGREGTQQQALRSQQKK